MTCLKVISGFTAEETENIRLQFPISYFVNIK